MLRCVFGAILHDFPLVCPGTETCFIVIARSPCVTPTQEIPSRGEADESYFSENRKHLAEGMERRLVSEWRGVSGG